MTGGPDLPQERRLVTEIPGPRSVEQLDRRGRYVAAGVGTTLPVFVEAAGGGVLVDVDGNSLIDLGSGIAVASVGNAAPARRRAGRRAGRARSPTPASWSRRTTATWTSARSSPSSPPATTTKRSALFNSGAEAVENAVKIARAAHRPDRGRRVRPRLPRPHQPHDGDDRQEHALQARLRPVRRRGLPGADVLPVPRAGGDLRRGRRPTARSTYSRSRSARPTSPAW